MSTQFSVGIQILLLVGRTLARRVSRLVLCGGTFLLAWPALSIVPSIASSSGEACTVSAAGQVHCWGGSLYGYSYLSTGAPATGELVEIDMGSPVEQISLDDSLGCALMVDRSVKCWGYNSLGVFSLPAAYQFYSPTVIAGLTDVVAIHATGGAACAVIAGGTVKCWGSNINGQLGDGTQVDRASPTTVMNLAGPATHVRVSRMHACARLETGAIQCWGVGANADRSIAPRIVFAADFVRGGMFAPFGLTCVLAQTGEVACLSEYTGTTDVLPGAHDVIELVGTLGGTLCLIDLARSVRCTGANQQGQIGSGGPNTFSESWSTVDALGTGAVRIAVGMNHVCALMMGGGVKCWGDGVHRQLGLGPERAEYETRTPLTALQFTPTTVSMGVDSACASAPSGATQCWGRNTDGQLGDGTQNNRWLPTPPLSFNVNPYGVATSYTHSCAVNLAGEVLCWGRNSQGQVGPVATSDVIATPIGVGDLPAVPATVVRVGASFSCAIIAAEAWCWGGNDYGSLGRSTLSNYSSPPGLVSGLPNTVTDLSLGAYHGCAVASSAAWCWGAGGGRLGDGSLEDRFSASQVRGLSSGVLSVSSGAYHSCALLDSGAVVCWGINWNGQVGDGTNANALTPVVVDLGGQIAVKIVAGGEQTCALLASGALKCWGALLQPNGSSPWQSFLNPTDVYAHGANVASIAVAANGMAFCSLKTNQQWGCWGFNWYGGIGQGTAGYRPVPNLFVPDLNVWGKASLSVLPSAIAAGDTVTLQMLIPGPTPSGPVRFERNGQVIAGCESVLIVQGVATCNTVVPAVGQYTFGATYVGDFSYPPSAVSVQGVATGGTSVTLAGWSFNLLASHTLLTLGRPTFVGAVNPAPTGTIRLTFPGQSCTLYLSLANPTCLISAFPSGLNQLLLAEYSGDENYRATTQEYRLNIVAGLDVNADGVVDSTDWLWVSRYVLGFRGASLSAGLASPNAKRSNPDIENYISANTTLFDIDLDGRVLGGTDMVLFSRFLSGVQGAALTGGAVGTFAFRPSAADIRSYLTYFTR